MNQLNDALRLLTNKLQIWLNQLVLMLPNLLIATLVLVITFVVARLLRKATEKVLPRISHSAALNNLASAMVYIVVVLMGVFFALGILKLDKTVTSLLAGVGIIGLALGFAFQDIAANFISGVIIAVRKPFGVGDVIETNGHFGTIERINMRTIDMRRQTGELVKVPNRKVFESAQINFTYFGLRRIDLRIRVLLTEDLDNVIAVILEAMQGITGQVDGKEVEVFFEEFADASIEGLVRFWIHYARQVDYVQAKSEAIMKIKKAFDTHHIIIPLPAQVVHTASEWQQGITDRLKAKVPPPVMPEKSNLPEPLAGTPPKGITFEEATDLPDS